MSCKVMHSVFSTKLIIQVGAETSVPVIPEPNRRNNKLKTAPAPLKKTVYLSIWYQK